MHVSSGFLLLETAPGREASVLDQLTRFHAVTHHSVIYPAAIAVRVEATTGVDAIAAQLRALDGVTRTRLYRARHT